jgi:hypothetical protein
MKAAYQPAVIVFTALNKIKTRWSWSFNVKISFTLQFQHREKNKFANKITLTKYF